MVSDELKRQALAGDAHAREVYADALLADGDPRGELIALELAGKPSTRLRQRHGEAWFGVPWHCVKTAGGFPVGLAIAHRPAPAALAAEVPELEVATAPTGVREAYPRVRRLTLQGDTHDLRGQLARAPRLEALVLGGVVGPIGGPLAHLEQLRVLGLASVRGASDLFHRFFNLDLARLEELDLRSCGLNHHALSTLLARPLPALRVLKLSGNHLGDQGTAVLQRALRHLPALERLEAIDCDIEDVTGMAITERADLPATLSLMGCAIEIVPVGRDRHLVLVDGEHRKVRLRTAHSRDGEPSATTDAEPADDAPLEPLYYHLGLGPRRQHTADGARVWLSRQVDVAYATSYTTTELAELDLRDDVVGITLERHVEAED